MNNVSLTGRLTATPELKTTQSGVDVCSFNLAVTRPRQSDKTDFIPCVAWRKTAEFISKYFDKGQKIEITGILTSRSYEDKNGNKRTAIELMCENVGFAESKHIEQTEQKQPDIPNFTEFEDVTGVSDDDLPF